LGALFDLSANLNEQAQQGLYRSRHIVESPQGINLICDGKSVINFCSNDYLGLANHPDVINAFKSALDKYGVGSGSAHLICGHSNAHHQLEEELAAFAGRERALLFSAGYMANMGAISALVGRGDTVLEDRLNHASLLDGGLLSGARFKRYAHADVEHLSSLLAREKQQNFTTAPSLSNPLVVLQGSPEHSRRTHHEREYSDSIRPEPVEGRSNRFLIVTDGLFSMDGDLAPLQALSDLAKQYGAWLMVDDAHGLGVLGENGGGILEQTDLKQDDVQVLVGTLGKAFGTFGAFVAGSDELIETLIQKARAYIYTTALPPAIAEATRASLKIIQTESWRREKLKQLTSRFRTGAVELGLPLMASTSPIQPILIGEAERAVAISNALFNQGFLIGAIRPPTVPKGSARLRITLSAMHEDRHIDQMLDALAKESA
jgi:8-amino-7-oxononanoate synthase